MPDPFAAGALVLDTPAPHPTTARVTGFDPSGPREIWLWRLAGDSADVVARGRSGRDGALAFPDLLIPAAGLELVATPAGGAPGDREASSPRRIPGRPPQPPRPTRLEFTEAGVRVWLEPVSPVGEVVVADADGNERARRPVAAWPAHPRRPLALDVPLSHGDAAVLLGHESPDGRRSAWRPLALEGPIHPEEEDHVDEVEVQ